MIDQVNRLRSLAHGAAKHWNHFWFEFDCMKAVGLFRCLSATVIFLAYLVRFVDFKLFFTNAGMMPVDRINDFVMQGYQPLVHLYISSDLLGWWVYLLFLVLLLLIALGVVGRSLTWLAFLIHVSFLQRNPSIVYGADLLTTFWLFYLSFMNSNAHFSILNLYKKNRKVAPLDIFTSMAGRFVQLQACVIYTYTGMEKLKGSTWWDGTAIWYVLGNRYQVPWDFSFISHWPILIAFMTFLTLIFEIYFGVIVWVPRLRKPWLTLGVVMHSIVAVLMGLPFFSLLMLSSYVLFGFLDPDFSWLRRRVRTVESMPKV